MHRWCEIITNIKTHYLHQQPKKFHRRAMNVPESDAQGFIFFFFFLFLVPDCWCLFTGIAVINYDHLHSAAIIRCQRAQMWEWRVTFFFLYLFIYVFLFFLSNWDGAPLGVGALRRLHTLRIGSGGTASSQQEVSYFYIRATERKIDLHHQDTNVFLILFCFLKSVGFIPVYNKWINK